MTAEKPFGKFRSLFFPIHGRELSLFIPLTILMVLLCFNYTLLRNTKDALIVTSSGAETIPFIKVWVMLPTALLLAIVFAKLVNLFGQERTFYLIISLFLLYYALFIFLFFPYRDLLHPHALADALEEKLPSGCYGLISVMRYWTFTSFYVMSELWSSMILTTLFWGFANEVTKLGQARRFYSVLASAGNIAALIAGWVCNLLIEYATASEVSISDEVMRERTLMLIICTVIIVGLCAMSIFFWMNRTALQGARYDEIHLNKKELQAKKKSSIRDSLFYISNSRYLLSIAVIVISYNLVINLAEILWKDKLSLLYPNFVDYQSYMNYVTIATSLFSTVTALFMGQIISYLGWTKTALLTPIVMLITCFGFFGSLLFSDFILDILMMALGTTPLALAVFFGSVQNSLSRAAKYSVFDATKEMTFIPLAHEVKLKGKAAVDGVGSRLGKSGGSLIYQMLLFITADAVQYLTAGVAVILFTAIVLWIIAVTNLGKRFKEVQEEHDERSSAAVKGSIVPLEGASAENSSSAWQTQQQPASA